MILNPFNILDIKVTELENHDVAKQILNGLRTYSAPCLGSGTLEPFSVYILDKTLGLIGGITGAIRQYPSTKTAWVHNVWVQEAFRGRGLGGQLCTYLEYFAYKKQCQAIQLEIFDFQGRTFYEKQGYQSIGILSRALGDFDKFFMRKKPVLSSIPRGVGLVFVDESGDETIKQAIVSACDQVNTSYLGTKGLQQPFSIYLPGLRSDIMGGITGTINNLETWVHVMWVDARYTGQGVGKLLWKKLEAYLLTKGCSALFVATLSFQAKPFYEKLGCRCQGTISQWMGGYDQHYFEKKLTL